MGRCQVETWVTTLLQSSWQEGNGSMRETMTQGPGKKMAHITSQIPSALSQSYDPISMQRRWGSTIYSYVQEIEEDSFWEAVSNLHPVDSLAFFRAISLPSFTRSRQASWPPDFMLCVEKYQSTCKCVNCLIPTNLLSLLFLSFLLKITINFPT